MSIDVIAILMFKYQWVVGTLLHSHRVYLSTCGLLVPWMKKFGGVLVWMTMLLLLLLGLASIIAHADLVIRPSDHVLLGTDYHLYQHQHHHHRLKETVDSSIPDVVVPVVVVVSPDMNHRHHRVQMEEEAGDVATEPTTPSQPAVTAA